MTTSITSGAITRVSSEGTLFYCATLGKWFTIEAVDASPRLMLVGKEVQVLDKDKEFEFAS